WSAARRAEQHDLLVEENLGLGCISEVVRPCCGIPAIAKKHGAIPRALAERCIHNNGRYPSIPDEGEQARRGRGNQQLRPVVIRRIGAATRTPVLRFDTGDANLDCDMISRKLLTVIVGYRRTRLVRVAE